MFTIFMCFFNPTPKLDAQVNNSEAHREAAGETSFSEPRFAQFQTFTSLFLPKQLHVVLILGVVVV